MQNEKEIIDSDLFMMCAKLNESATSSLPPQYTIRNCRQDELDIWMSFPFDHSEEANMNRSNMQKYFKEVYSEKAELFFKQCLFVCNQEDQTIATCFSWKAYENITTIHWFKVKKAYEGNGIGRALLSVVISELDKSDYPLFLHTQAGSYRAIKLYSDFGFSLLTDSEIGCRSNDLSIASNYLKSKMGMKRYNSLSYSAAPAYILEQIKQCKINQF